MPIFAASVLKISLVLFIIRIANNSKIFAVDRWMSGWQARRMGEQRLEMAEPGRKQQQKSEWEPQAMVGPAKHDNNYCKVVFHLLQVILDVGGERFTAMRTTVSFQSPPTGVFILTFSLLTSKFVCNFQKSDKVVKYSVVVTSSMSLKIEFGHKL